MQLIDSLYAAVARQRRRWYESASSRRRRLDQPVVSIGSLSVGGSGKTPFTAFVATLLRDAGERPAILSRGYGRREHVDGVTVVRDAEGIRVGLECSGDEPMMLAHALDRVAVVVASERFLAGRLAESRLGATVHLLDDGFQHVQLERDVDLLVMDAREIDHQATLPSGRLREPLGVAVRAHALLLSGAGGGEATTISALLGVPQVFEFTRRSGQPTGIDSSQPNVTLTPETRVLCVAGIAKPERFFDDARATGAAVVSEMRYSDHHPFSVDDIRNIGQAASEAGADLVLTTEKDLVRLRPYQPLPFTLAALPLVVEMVQESEFRSWLLTRVESARRGRLRG